MATKKKVSLLKQILVVGGALVVVQLALLFYFQGQQKPVTASEAIQKAISKIDDPQKRDQLRVQAAVRLYQAQNQKLPAKLDDLVPLFLDRLPRDPQTGEPFEYRVTGQSFTIGKTSPVVAAAAKSAGTKGKTGSPDTRNIALLSTFDEKTPSEAYVYDPRGKKDPFLPFDVSPPTPSCDRSQPLTCWELGQLRLTAVLKGFAAPKAIIEAVGDNKGYTVEKGSKIGRNHGEVVEIEADKIVILETLQDFTGAVKTNTVELRLRTKDQEEVGSKRRN